MDQVLEILQSLTQPQNRHAAVVHFPTAISVPGLPFVGLLFLSKGQSKTWRNTVIGLYGFMFLTALVAQQAGTASKGQIGNVSAEARELIDLHEQLASWVWALSLSTAVFGALTRMDRARQLSMLLCALTAFVISGLVGFVGHLGGTAVYSHGVGTHHASPASAESEDEATGDPRERHFTKHILPLLSKNCMGCHGPGQFASSELDLTNAAGLMKGGSRGTAVVPGHPADSLLMQVVDGSHETLRMPLGADPLSQSDQDHIRRWISEGAVWKAAAE